jgi:hypothetical protein
VRLKFHLGALSKRETREYIEHRLEVAGSEGREIIQEDAYDPIFTYTGGVPRLINTLCDTAMLCGFAEETAVITRQLVMTAVEELQWSPFVERYKDREDEGFVDTDDTGRNLSPLPSPAHFEVLFRDQKVSRFDLPIGRSIIGRTTDNDLQIASKFISRHHAQVSTKVEGCVLEDLNSTNGVYIESRRVKRHQLADGDIIQLGEHKLVYHDLRSRTGSFAIVDDIDDADEDEFEPDVYAEDDAGSGAENEADAERTAS